MEEDILLDNKEVDMNVESGTSSDINKEIMSVKKISPLRKDRKYQGMKFHELQKILNSDVLAIKFCQDNGLIARSVTCYCGKKMFLKRKCTNTNVQQVFVWKCRYRNKDDVHHSTCSIRRGSWFEKSKLSISEILWIAYMWIYEYSYSSIVHETEHSNETILYWLSSCRDICKNIMESRTEPIGGLGKIVEIYFCECNKLPNENKWVFCVREQYSCKSFTVIIEDQTTATIMPLFNQFILPDSTVLMDNWNFLQKFSKEDFDSLVIKQSIDFYDTVSKTSIEDYKQFKKITSRPLTINEYSNHRYGAKFCEILYRKSLSYSQDSYLTFLKDISKIYIPSQLYIKTQID